MSWWVRPHVQEAFGAPWHLVILDRTACNRTVPENWDWLREPQPEPRERCRSCAKAAHRRRA